MAFSKPRYIRRSTVMLAAITVCPSLLNAQPSPTPFDALDTYCVDCHNYEDWAGEVAFDTANRADLNADAEIWEKAISKLRSGLMPPAGEPRPARAVLDTLAASLEQGLDAEPERNPGNKSIARMNRAEYANAIRDLLAFDASRIAAALPEDAGGEGFDNNAETLTMSPTLLEAYLAAAMEISRQALADPSIGATDIHYYRNGRGVQNQHIDGQALGTRGGMLIEHHFPLDAEYVFRIGADIQQAGWKNDEGRMWWCEGPAVDVAFNNVRIEVGDHRSFRLSVPAGPQQLAVALLDAQKCAGAGELYLGEALASVGGSIDEIEIQGPFNPVSGPVDTASRRQILRCQPANAAAEAGCAEEILSYMATRAYRRLIQAGDAELEPLLQQYRLARDTEDGDFELGIQYAVARLLVDPQFLYRFEREPAQLAAGEIYAISDTELASRLAFFLWSSIPDEQLLELAFAGRLSEPAVLKAQVERMLADSKAEALVSNFAGQWLQLRELAAATPQDPGFDEELRSAFNAETELFFTSIIRGDGSMLALLDAPYTYVNERLAQHYGIPGVRGSYMRRIELPEASPRRGLLGHGSILTATSIPNRTSPVVRGVWIVENLLGAPVPDPPPGVETDLSAAVADGTTAPATLRDRLEAHRADPVCGSCHGIMDPVGLALENFDLTGRWREHDNGIAIDASSALVDGTPLNGPLQLRAALLSRPETFLRTLTGKLLSYALGRELEYFDGPAVRAIVGDAGASKHSFSALVQGIVASEPFRYRVAGKNAATEPAAQTAASSR